MSIKRPQIKTIRFAFRDEMHNIFMMTKGHHLYPKYSQIFVCKNSEIPHNLKCEYFILDSKRVTSYALSNFGKEISKETQTHDKQYLAAVESVLVVKVIRDVFEKLSKEYFPVWDVESPLQYFGSKTFGYLWLFRTYEILENVNEHYMEKGRGGRNYYYLLRDHNDQPIEVNVNISEPVLSDDLYSNKKSDLIRLLVENNAFVKEIPGVENISCDLSQSVPKDNNEFIDKVNQDIEQSDQCKFQHKGTPREKQNPLIQNGRKYYPRDRQVSLNALAFANFRCEADPDHEVFLRKKREVAYTEPHHLVPMSFSDGFDVSLDIEENIVSLCSNCHNLLHYGRDNKVVIERLFQKRKDELSACGIAITLEQLLEMYQ